MVDGKPSQRFAQILRRMKALVESLGDAQELARLLESTPPGGLEDIRLSRELLALYWLNEDLDDLNDFWIRSGSPVLSGISKELHGWYLEVVKPLIPRLIEFAVETRLPPEEEEYESRLPGEPVSVPGLIESSAPQGLSTTQDPIAETLSAALEYSQRGQAIDAQQTSLDEASLQRAEALIEASWFAPSSWLKNAKDLPPAVFPRASTPLERSLQTQLYDLYVTYIVGNYRAAIALSRALVEVSLRSQAEACLRGIGTQQLRDIESGKCRLGNVLCWYEAHCPEFPAARVREDVKVPGDRVLHSVDLRASRLASVARSSILATVDGIEFLYSTRNDQS